MTIRIAINGFGRIGRTVTRIISERDDIELVAINDLTSPEQLAYALKYDSIFGRMEGVVAEGDQLITPKFKARVTAIKDPAEIDWASLNVDFVIESTGIFRKRAQIEPHLRGGAKRVLLSVPPKDALDATVVLGVNDAVLTGKEKLVSNASCTTNCAAPLAKVLHEAFGIEKGFINTIHAYTNDQRLMDMPHSDWRRSRAAALNVIPTSTGAAAAVGKVIPELNGKLDGMAYRVPVPDGSVVDMVVQVGKKTNAEEVNAAFKKAAEGPLKGILSYETDPVVSGDIIGNPHSSVFDSQLTQVLDGNFVKIVSWYDNEYGYSNRMVDLMLKLSNM
ncbi:type I glyceraldehyde-3-phosphate dehydrogenase [Acanthopleuribacter pedis]|uniref:Type I glyceraldehyde-3-phosphate dehydrogenase n=1 Tax=Acanthopleuribacter pedis TaxID=442870 RepID=A0A8J7QL72_9BACT|nr:type I glyceraldehyde-3-phosphate dehydrogenase [Acanthopleuribacter pedis]MBO1323141.1 type I glyceraldehyde-3-phosphate dehydrogenase [Acanthopleuribacter pedis]